MAYHTTVHTGLALALEYHFSAFKWWQVAERSALGCCSYTKYSLVTNHQLQAEHILFPLAGTAQLRTMSI